MYGGVRLYRRQSSRQDFGASGVGATGNEDSAYIRASSIESMRSVQPVRITMAQPVLRGYNATVKSTRDGHHRQ
jgi:hypothetical protein